MASKFEKESNGNSRNNNVIKIKNSMDKFNRKLDSVKKLFRKQ